MQKLFKDDVEVRKFDINDIENKIKMINDKNNNKYLHYDLPLEYNNTLNWYKKNMNNNDRLDCTITYKGKFAGLIGLLNIDSKNKKAEYYICIDYNFARRGIAFEASNLLITYAFNELEINKIYLYTEKENIKAQKLFEKIGFKNEGLLIDDIIYNGKKISRYTYGLCRSNYNGQDTN